MTTQSLAVRTHRSPTRCPYCHDQVSLETPWVACRACLARHHADCWGDVHACAACGVSQCLPDVGADETSPPPRESETRQLLRRLEKGPGGSLSPLLDYAGSLLSAGLVPAFAAESRLIRHADANRTLETGKPRPRFAPDSLEHTVAGARSRLQRGLGSFVAAVALALPGLACLSSRSAEGVGWLLVSAALTLWIPTLLLWLARHHRAVRRHDASQLGLTVHRYGLDADTTYRLIARHEDAWRRTAGSLTRSGALWILISGLCFPLAWLTLPLWVARGFQVPLEEHARRELLGAFRW
jgi:hypothetical protein